MEIILLEDIRKIGFKDEIVDVKPGFARNYLIPKGLASQATEKNKKVLAEVKKQRAFKEEKYRNEAKALVEVIKSLDLKVGAKVSSTGKIFGSVNNIQIADAIKKLGYDIDRKNISLKEDIKELGTFNANIKLYKEINVDVTFEVLGE